MKSPRFRSSLPVLLVALLLSARRAHGGGGAQAGSPVAVAAPALEVLFIGNSYTYVNDLPALLKALASASGVATLHTEQDTPGGQSLEGHWDKGAGAAPKLIAGRRWNYVIIQEQSRAPITKKATFLAYAALIDRAAKSQGANSLFYLTWARRDAPEQQAALDEAYQAAASAARARLVPVGPAWATVRHDRPDIDLFAKDGSHPSPAGTYLAACVFYAVLFHRSPEGISLTKAPVDAPYLARTAWQTVQAQTP